MKKKRSFNDRFQKRLTTLIVGCKENQSLWLIHFTYFDHINSRRGEGVGLSSIFFENYKNIALFSFNQREVIRNMYFANV